MLNNIRNFAKTKSAGILVGILIIPFVLWGMGGVFSGGNKNNIAKISNENISTMDFQNYLNESNIEFDRIKDNIDKNILEEILSELISKKMLYMEMQDLKLTISDKVLNKKLKANKSFLDANNKFSRVKYEKFLLSNRMTAPGFEMRLRESEMQKDLFSYLGGGLKSPQFLVNKNYKEQTKKITINYINLSKVYKKKDDFTDKNILEFITENQENLKEKLINFKYSKIEPKNLLGLNEFTNLYFEKIDEIEDEILNGLSFEDILKKYNLESNTKENFKFNRDNNLNNFYKKIYENEKIKKVHLLDENDFYILYEITSVKKVLPDMQNKKFAKKIKQMIFNKNKFEFNNNLINKINDKDFNQNDFEKLANNNLMSMNIDSITDDSVFNKESIKFLYTKSKDDFALISDKDKNIYLIKVKNISYSDISNKSEIFSIYKKQTDDNIMNTIYSSYDFFLNDKYEIKVNEKTLERVKNYFQ